MAGAIRYALGDDVSIGKEHSLFLAAARIRHPGKDDLGMLTKYGAGLGPDGATAARYAWSVHSHDNHAWYAPQIGEKSRVYHRLRVDTDAVPSRLLPPECLAILRHPRNKQDGRYGYGISYALDAEHIRYSATQLPSSLEAFFAEGCSAIGNNVNWEQAQWHHKAYLAPLLDPTVPMTPMATLLLALALAAKEPGQAALAVDALVAAQREGRLAIPALADALHDLLATPLVMAARYRKTLQAAARLDPHMPAVVFSLLCRMAEIPAAPPPKDLAGLLELLQELHLAHRLPLPQTTLAALAQLKLSGTGRSVVKALLASSGKAVTPVRPRARD